MEFVEIILLFRRNTGDAACREGMERFAITADVTYGTGLPFVRGLAGRIKQETKDAAGRNALAKKLWRHGAHETKLLAALVAEPSIGWDTSDSWLGTCQNWAEVDQLCMNLLWKMPGSEEKALAYSRAKQEWRKRAGFVLMAVLAMRRKGTLDRRLSDRYFSAILRESADERNFVKKAVNWALRHMGKCVDGERYKKALGISRKLAAGKDKTARWIGKDALRELEAKGPPKLRKAPAH